MALSDDELREAAAHRGLKLVKSRRRKPGVGDYGLFGLTDASGKALIGIGDGGLTATPEQIAEYLRKGEVSTWAESAEITPARPKPKPSADETSADDEEEPPSVIRPRRRGSARAGQNSPQERSVSPKPVETADEETQAPTTRSAPKRVPTPMSEREPERELAIRTARPADADALRTLLASLGIAPGAAEIKRGLAEALARKEPILVADRGGIIGCLAWHIVPTLQQGRIARITMIAVREDGRRHGVGRALYKAALAEFGKRKVRSVEAMSDIEVRNANAFYRALGLKQASYRFAADL
jgi:ribosomal protein S18 acetylase RimI-like enzyme